MRTQKFDDYVKTPASQTSSDNAPKAVQKSSVKDSIISFFDIVSDFKDPAIKKVIVNGSFTLLAYGATYLTFEDPNYGSDVLEGSCQEVGVKITNYASLSFFVAKTTTSIYGLLIKAIKA